MSLSKWLDAVNTARGRSATRFAVLVLPGSFSPVHTQHLRLMDAARVAIEAEGGFVAGGFLVLSDDAYVSGKLGGTAWPLATRLRWCRLATADSDWISVAPWAEFGSFRAAHRVRRWIEAECAVELRARPVDAIVTMGSDTAVRVLRSRLAWQVSGGDRHADAVDRPPDRLCCVKRPGPSGEAEIVEVEACLAPRLEATGLRVVVAHVPEGVLLDVNSEAIRRALRTQDWDGLRRSGWLHSAVLDALREAPPE